MAKKPLALFLASLLFLPGNVIYSAGQLSLESLIEQALKNNPEIRASRMRSQAAGARVWQAVSLDDPMIEFEYDKISADRELSEKPMKTVGVSQSIPFPTKIYLRAKIASRLAKMEYQNYKTKEREIIANIKSTYAELFTIYRLIEINKENKGILEQFLKVATARYATVQGTQADALRAQVELAKVENELIMLEQRRLSTQAKLNILLNRDPKEESGIPDAQKPIKFVESLDELYTLAKNNNPELKSYRYGIEKGRAAYQLSLNEFLPDFEVKVKQMIRKDRLENDMWAGMLGVTIPLWFHKQAFGVQEMKSELKMLEAEFTMKENMVLFDIRDAHARVEANKKIIELYETAFIPQAEQTVAAALKEYESQKNDFLTLLDSQRMLLDFKLDRYRAILELRMALADLERAVGVDVDFN
ncbi:MAG: TolC family protein [Candidatus Omnitrophica bacterium]|nr:TolC family protein [Candidatus Omnitrophota bacterium]